MSLRLSHLMTLTISRTWVARFTLPSMRCERSPTPVRVGVNTLCPRFCRRSATRRQHQPPCQAPCTRIKVFGAPVCADADALPKAATLAPAPAFASTPRRVMAPSLVEVIMSSLRLVVGAILLGILFGMRPVVLNGADANAGPYFALCLPQPRGPCG